jgi:hypothetical protein
VLLVGVFALNRRGEWSKVSRGILIVNACLLKERVGFHIAPGGSRQVNENQPDGGRDGLDEEYLAAGGSCAI